MNGKLIKVHIIDVPYHADHEYTYFVKEEYLEQVTLGSAVSVPFGKTDRARLAIVVDDNAEEIEGEQIKEIHSPLSPYFSLSQEMLELCKFMKSTTLCTMGEAVKCIIPSALVYKTKEVYRVSDRLDPPKYKELYSYILKNPETSHKKLNELFDDAVQGLKYLTKNGFILKDTFVDEREKSKLETRVSLNVDVEEAVSIADGEGQIKLRGKKQGEILKLLCEYTELSDKEIYESYKN